CVPGQYGSEPKAAGGNGTQGLKPPVAGGVKDLHPSELKELEFAPERPAAKLPEAKFPAAEPRGELVGVAGAQRLQRHARLLVPQAIAARLRFSDLIVPIPEIAWKTRRWRVRRGFGHLLDRGDVGFPPEPTARTQVRRWENTA